MPFNDGIERKFCFSLTDFHDFEKCPFLFFVKHDLNKKYEIEEGNFNMALGTLLDQSIKIFHKSKAYGQPPEYLSNLVRAAERLIKARVGGNKTPSFYSSITPFLNEETIAKAAGIFQEYYKTLNCKIKPSLGDVGFYEWVIKDKDHQYKLWGGPDTFELGEDGIPEVIDYKYREDLRKGKLNMDMDLMPKIYMLLSSKYLLEKGYKKARFVVRFWQDPLENSFIEEFDLNNLSTIEELFREKIEGILITDKLLFCETSFCLACNSKNRSEYIRLLGVFRDKYTRLT